VDNPDNLPVLTLIRGKDSDQGTPGQLDKYKTLELRWDSNNTGTSCIIADAYRVDWCDHPKHGMCYQLQNVKDRDAILIHSANFAGDTTKGWQAQLLGCIAIGYEIGTLENDFGNMQLAVLRSKDALNDFENQMGRKSFILNIVEL
jgi:hypothetical protein